MMNKRKILAIVVASATFMGSVPVMAANFTDINNVPWEGSKAYINSVADAGLMIGNYDAKGKLVFRAKDNVSYCETMQLVYALVQKNMGTSVTSAVQTKWTSVMNGYRIPTWAQPAVAYGLENSIITISDIPGFVSAKGVAANATRQDVAIMFGRALKEYGTLNNSANLTYNDKSSINVVAVPYVDLLTRLGVIAGDDLGNFNPKKTVNRAEMAVFVSKSSDVMKKGNGQVESGSINGTVTSVAPFGPNTIITVKDSSRTMSFTGTDSTPVLNGSSRVFLSSLKEGYVVLVSYAGQELTSVLVTSTGNSSGGSSSGTTTKKDVEGTYYSINEESIKLKVDGSTKTYKFKNDDYSNAEFYKDGSKSNYSRFKSSAETTKTIKLTLDSDGYIIKADLLNILSATYSSISNTYVTVKVDGSSEKYYFDGKNQDNVTFRVDGKSKTHSQFKSAASSGDKVELKIDENDSDEITEINLVTSSSGKDGTFYSISSSALKVKVDGSTKTYEYPDDDASNTSFYVDGNSKSYSSFKSAASEGATIKVELDSRGYLKKVYLENTTDGEIKGTFISITSTYVNVKKSGSSSEKKYYYEDNDKDNAKFYYNDTSKDYSYINSKAEEGDTVRIVLDKWDNVTKVYVSTKSSSSSGDASGVLTYLNSTKIKLGNGSYLLFYREKASSCNISVKDGTTKITDYDELKEAMDDGKKMQVDVTLNRDEEVTDITGYVIEARGVMTSFSKSSETLKIKGDRSKTSITYNIDSDVDITIDEGFSNSYTGLENAYKSSEYSEVYTVLTINKSGNITHIDATCS